MPFTQFTSPNKVKQVFTDLNISKQDFIPAKITEIEYPSYLERDVKFALKTFKPSEAFADKFLIAPLLNEVWINHSSLNLWTQPFLRIDEILQGRPDYVISPVDNEQYEILSIPIVVVVEAKQENFTAGWGQCLAEMVACQKLNKSTNTIIYGIVSTGQIWEFGKLDKNAFVRNSGSYSIYDLHKTYNVVNYIFEQAEKEIPNVDTSVMIENNGNETNA